MKDLYRKYISDELPEDQKSEAQKATEVSSKKYTDFFKAPLDRIRTRAEEENAQGNKLKSTVYKALALTYKTIAGFAINPIKLESNKEKKSFWGQVKAEPSYGKKALKIVTLFPKVLLETAVETAQFTIRNTIKQPVMTAFRFGATINNTKKYLAAKIKGDNDQAKIETANIKYQMRKALKGAVATVAIAAIDFAIFASAGMATPSFGVATAAVGHVAEVAHISSLGKDTADVASQELRGRRSPDELNQKSIDGISISKQKTIDEVNPIKTVEQATNLEAHRKAEVMAHNLRDSLGSREVHSVDSSGVRFSAALLEQTKNNQH